MQLDDALNRLACDAQSPRDKLLGALEMYGDGEVSSQSDCNHIPNEVQNVPGAA